MIKNPRRKGTLGEMIVATIILLIMGTMYTFVNPHQNAPVQRSDARHVEASYSDYRKIYAGKHTDEVSRIVLYFSDYESLEIKAGITKALCARIDALHGRERLSMLVHPDSDTILELKIEGEILLRFENSVEGLARKRTSSRTFGIICYALAAHTLYEIKKKRYVIERYVIERE